MLFSNKSYMRVLIAVCLFVFLILVAIAKTIVDNDRKVIFDKCLEQMNDSPACDDCKIELFNNQ